MRVDEADTASECAQCYQTRGATRLGRRNTIRS
jgi:hypothetical protein